MLSHFTRLHTLSPLSPSATALVTAGINPPDPPVTPWRPDESQPLDLGVPRLPYSLFSPLYPHIIEHLGCLPLRLLGDLACTDLLLICSNPNFAILDSTGHLIPLSTPLPHWTAEQIRWALHSLCLSPPIRLRRPPPLQKTWRIPLQSPQVITRLSRRPHPLSPSFTKPHMLMPPSHYTRVFPRPRHGHHADQWPSMVPRGARYNAGHIVLLSPGTPLPEHQRTDLTETDGAPMVHARPPTRPLFFHPSLPPLSRRRQLLPSKPSVSTPLHGFRNRAALRRPRAMTASYGP